MQTCLWNAGARGRGPYSVAFCHEGVAPIPDSSLLAGTCRSKVLLCDPVLPCLEKLTPQAPKWHLSSLMGWFRKIARRRCVAVAALQASRTSDIWRLQQHQNGKEVTSKVFLAMESPCLWLCGAWGNHRAFGNGRHPPKWNHEVTMHAAGL